MLTPLTRPFRMLPPLWTHTTTFPTITQRDTTMTAQPMAGNTGNDGARRRGPWRIAAWFVAALLLLLPLVAMRFTDEVNWTFGDFVVAAFLLFVPLGIYELMARRTGSTAYRAASGIALVVAFLLVWLNGAVSIIGSENNPANLLYAGVLAIGAVGAIVARFRPNGMALAMNGAALALVVIAVVALGAGWGAGAPVWPWPVVILNGFFASLLAGSAVLFRRAAQEEPPTGAGPMN